MATLFDRVESVLIEDEIQSSFIDYAMSVIVSRALPDVRDGLKPVHRRILFSMMEGNLTPDRPRRKSAAAVGDVIKKYHPHGDQAVYDAMVRMAQDFSLRYPLIDPQGNFGTVDGDPPAAMRYTESRLGPLAMELLRDIDKETVEFIPNFDGYEQEPTVLPARFPNLLANGSAGIAVGLATNIPPHNLGEIIDATIAAIDNPKITVAELMQFVKGPDFPTAGYIIGTEGIREAYETGRGSIRMRAKVEIDETRTGKQVIAITELPYMVNKARLAEKIAGLVDGGKIKDISDIKDHSSRQGMRLTVELKRGANPHVVLNLLYKHTQLQDNFGVNFVALVDGVPRTLNLAQAIGHYIDHQVDVVTRRTKYELRKAEERAHILEGLLIALANIDEVIKIIRASNDADEARGKLMERFKLSEIQTNYILDMPLRRLTKLERGKIEEEHRELMALIKHLTALLKDPKKLRELIKEELLDIRKRFADERRTQIRPAEGEFDIEDLIAEEDVVITVTRAGYVKRLPIETYRRQGRGGRGVIGANLKEEDVVQHVFTTTTHNWLLVLTNRGRIYRSKVHEVPEGSRTGRGLYVANLPGMGFSGDEKIATVLNLKDYGQAKYMVFATKNGIVKKTPLAEYDSPRQGGLIAINLREGDELIDAQLSNGDDDILLISRKAQAIRFKESATRPMGRSTGGVIGMRLAPDDDVISMSLARRGEEVISITELGYGKRTPMDQYPLRGRGGKGVFTARLTPKTGPLAGAFVGTKDQDVFVINASGIVIRVLAGQLRRTGRQSQGVRVMRLEKGDKIVAIAPVIHQMDEE
jgi:DNA gyrase subunit A